MEAPYLDSLGSYVGQLGTGLYKRFLDTVLNRGEEAGKASLYHELTSIPRHKAKTVRIGNEHMKQLQEHHYKLPDARLSQRAIGKRDLDRLNKNGPYGGYNKTKTTQQETQEVDEDLMFLEHPSKKQKVEESVVVGGTESMDPGTTRRSPYTDHYKDVRKKYRNKEQEAFREYSTNEAPISMNVKEQQEAFQKTEKFATLKKEEENELKAKDPVQSVQPIQSVQSENVVTPDPNNPENWQNTETKGDIKYRYEKPPVVASTLGFDTSKSYVDLRTPTEQVYIPDALEQPMINPAQLKLGQPASVDSTAALYGFLTEVGLNMAGGVLKDVGNSYVSGVGTLLNSVAQEYKSYYFPNSYSQAFGQKQANRFQLKFEEDPMLRPEAYLSSGLAGAPLQLTDDRAQHNNQVQLMQKDQQNYLRYALM